MKNRGLVRDYLDRCVHRLAAIDVLFERGSWADVVRQSQEAVELALKAALRHSGIEAPRIHDVGGILKQETAQLDPALRPHATRLAEVSHRMRRDRELAFYGSEDLTPSEFYGREDAERARDEARWAVTAIRSALKLKKDA